MLTDLRVLIVRMMQAAHDYLPPYLLWLHLLWLFLLGDSRLVDDPARTYYAYTY